MKEEVFKDLLDTIKRARDVSMEIAASPKGAALEEIEIRVHQLASALNLLAQAVAELAADATKE
jgi:hypothetical protein